jgi:hypothetical protein
MNIGYFGWVEREWEDSLKLKMECLLNEWMNVEMNWMKRFGINNKFYDSQKIIPHLDK